MIVFNLIRGMFMAFADSVPGVSGGTIAFVMGFYNQFIDSINALTSRSSKEEKKEALIFLLKIGIGWAVGMIISILFIASIFDTYIYHVSSLFLGFIIFSIPLIYKEEKETIKENTKHVIYLLLGIIIVALITYFNPVSGGSGVEISSNQFSFGLGVYAFIAGMIAISAMVLPGISGSTLLLIFGLYSTIITGVKDILHFNFASLPLIIVFGIGVLVGIVSVVRIISKLLKTKRSQLIYFIFGLMIGSLYAVVMGPTTLDIPKAPMSLSTFNIIFFIIGALIIFGLEKLKTIMQR
ncbi:DUF368 domain-containing protein [Cellulosilyticum sp. ST5]|uniref:DUF368 domain-containing protein n=1 Tax=Cellulosilyticum sp. ST5 TaxID=3055805 RepID=UPI003977C5B4